MSSFSLTSHFYLPKSYNLSLPIKTKSQLNHPQKQFPKSSQSIRIKKQKQGGHDQSKTLILDTENANSFQVFPRSVILGAVSIGFVMFLLSVDEHNKAVALGPEGPLVEEFWDNMRRYGLFVLTVSTGVAYTILEPIIELLRNPITAILIVVIFGGSFYIVSQVLSAMVGTSEFNYQYGY